jgi:hypothetical protein
MLVADAAVWAHHPAALVALGLLIGCFGALVGVGGGIFLVPYFVQLLGWKHPLAVGTSLSIIFVNAVSGSIAYARQKRVDFALGALLAMGTVPGTFVGHRLGQGIGGPAFKLAFATVVTVAAVYLAAQPDRVPGGLGWFRRGWRRTIVDATGIEHRYEVNAWFGALASVGVGVVATLFGVGGGFIHVPVLILLYAVPPHVSVATSTFALSITAGVGALQSVVPWWSPTPQVDVVAMLYAGVGAVAGSQVGTRLAARMPGAALRVVLAAVMLAVAASMAWSGLR